MWALALFALTVFFIPPLSASPEGDGPPSVMFWNLENFFDWRNDSTGVSDAEFSSRGERRWTRKRFLAKSNAIAKTILWTASESGSLPDVVGFAEVENGFVLRRLLQTASLRKLDYKAVHFDSPDPRGIDVALLYRSSALELVDARPCHIYTEQGTVLPTRDILLVRLRRRGDGEDFAVLVNHHPSKYGGAAVSGPKREAAVRRLRSLVDSLQEAGVRRIIATGDFNDTPGNPVYTLLEPALVNLAEPVSRKGQGSIRYNGQWELIDMFFVSPPLAECRPRMTVLHVPFLETPDRAHGGVKPFRTYVSNRTVRSFHAKMHLWERRCLDHRLTDAEVDTLVQVINSYLGYFSHFKTFRIRKEMFSRSPLKRYVIFSGGWRKCEPFVRPRHIIPLERDPALFD